MIERIVLIASIFINIIFAVLLFFRSALNDIVKEWWKERQKVKKEKKERFIELRTNLLKLSNASSLLLVLTATNLTGPDSPEKQQMKPHWDGAAKSYGEIRDAIIRENPHMPKEIREAYDDFETEMQSATKEILNSQMYKEKLLEITQNVSSKIEIIIGYIDKHLY